MTYNWLDDLLEKVQTSWMYESPYPDELTAAKRLRAEAATLIQQKLLEARIAAAQEILNYRSYTIGKGEPSIRMPRDEVRRFVDEFDITAHINSWKSELSQLNVKQQSIDQK